jgi:hypothetical protein
VKEHLELGEVLIRRIETLMKTMDDLIPMGKLPVLYRRV